MTAPREPRPGGWWLRRPINNWGAANFSGRHSRLTLRFVTSLRGRARVMSPPGLTLGEDATLPGLTATLARRLAPPQFCAQKGDDMLITPRMAQQSTETYSGAVTAGATPLPSGSFACS
jgi:hypothetical protein